MLICDLYFHVDDVKNMVMCDNVNCFTVIVLITSVKHFYQIAT